MLTALLLATSSSYVFAGHSPSTRNCANKREAASDQDRLVVQHTMLQTIPTEVEEERVQDCRRRCSEEFRRHSVLGFATAGTHGPSSEGELLG